MDLAPANLIARSLLYEGYVLDPYRSAAPHSRPRRTPGALVPQVYAEAHPGESWFLRAECLVRGGDDAALSVRVRFLHVVERGGSHWPEATEEEVVVPRVWSGELGAGSRLVSFTIPASWETDGAVERTQYSIEGEVELSAERCGGQLFRVAVRAANLTPLEDPAVVPRDAALLRSLAAAHVVLRVRGGEFVSLHDPPEDLRPLAEACRNVGVWPVLVSGSGARDVVLAAPVVLPDYPRVAPEGAEALSPAPRGPHGRESRLTI
jgi:hydrogenase maturation protease